MSNSEFPKQTGPISAKMLDRVLVGAPEAQSVFQDPTRRGAIRRGGAVYKCRSDVDDVCQEVPFDTSGNAVFKSSVLDEKSGQWFGATLSSSGETDGPIVACAPRYVWYTRDLNRRDPVGTCFVSNGAFDHFEEYSPCRTMNWGYHRQGSCQAGFSAAINRDGDRLFVGAPGSYYWQGQIYSVDAHATFNYTPGYFGNPGYGAKGSVHQQSLEKRPAVFSTREGIPPDDDSYIGYSTVVGHFKAGQQYEGVAVGMPRGNKLKGKVLLFTWDLVNYKNLTVSKQIGSYFGYSLAAADVNGDKKLDLIVGAPMHTEPNNEGKYDVGRVYVFYQSGNAAESFNASHFLDGTSSKGRFGLSLASLGDLNQDGYDDLAVGAPYDGPSGRGAVYVFYGSEAGIRPKHGQVILAEDVPFGGGPTATFGFSLAGGMDLDGNEYPDMAVGAYLSDAAFFFRARPVVLIDGFVRFQTPGKQIDIKEKRCKLPNGHDGSCTAIDVCIKYTGKGIPDQLYLTVQYTLDTKKASNPRMGFLTRGTYTFNDTLLLYKDSRENCKTEQVYVKNEIRDKLTALEAEVRFFMVEDAIGGGTRDPRSPLSPVLDLNDPPVRRDSIVVQKNCGPDNVCVPNLNVEIVPDVKTYLLGSNRNLEFDVTVSNFAEDAYETTLELKYPEGIFYKKIDVMPEFPGILCSSRENRTVVCDVGNPLPSQRIAKFKILLQPYHKEGMPPSYEFDVSVNSTNPEPEASTADNRRHVSIDILIDAELEFRGESYPSTVHFNESLYEGGRVEREGDLGPQVTHVYFLANRGPAAVREAEVFLLWPLQTLGGGEAPLYLLDQPLTLGDVRCEAAPSNERGLQLDRHHRASLWDRLKVDTSSVMASASSSAYAGVATSVETAGGGVSSGVGVVNAGGGAAVDSASSGGDASLVLERRHEGASTTWGSMNERGEYELGEARRHTEVVGGVPVTRWENRTTVRDAAGNVVRTSLRYDGVRGEVKRQDANLTARWVDGKQVLEWENRTVVTDASGKVVRTYLWDDSSAEEERRRERLRQQEQRRIEEEEEMVRTIEEQRRTGGGGRVLEERRKQEEEARRRQEERMREEEERLRILEEQRRTGGGERVLEERRREEEARRRQEEEERRREEEEKVRILEEQRRTGGGGRVLEERRREEEARRRQEEEEKVRILEEQRRTGGGGRVLEERRRQEEERRRQEEERMREEEERILEERRRTGGGGRALEERRREEEARRRQEEERLRILEEQRRTGGGGRVLEERRRQEEERRRQEEERRRQEEERRRYFEEMERRRQQSTAYQVGGGSREGGGSTSGGRVLTGYFDDQGVYHDLPRDSSGRQTVTYNRTYTHDSSTTIPIEVWGGGISPDLGSGFTVQTLEVGGGGGVGAASGGGYRREWKAAGGSSSSGHIPPTFFHNSVEEEEGEEGGRRRRALGEGESPVRCNATRCAYIRCVVGALEKDKEVAIALRSRLNVRAVKELTNSRAVKVSSMMVGRITELPYVGRAVRGELKFKEIFTEVPGREAELVPEVAPLWVYVLSAVAGVVVLLLLIWLLSKCGFFKRNRPSSGPERQPLNRNGYHSGDEAL